MRSMFPRTEATVSGRSFAASHSEGESTRPVTTTPSSTPEQFGVAFPRVDDP